MVRIAPRRRLEGNGNTEKSYDPTQDSDWVEEVDGWKWIRRDEGVYAKSGPCQRCEHPIGFNTGSVIVSRMAAPSKAAEPPREWVECNCETKHPDTPEGRRGCGANGQIKSV